jgi:hypothetical protein
LAQGLLNLANVLSQITGVAILARGVHDLLQLLAGLEQRLHGNLTVRRGTTGFKGTNQTSD